jgi:hypothetical protein
VAREDLAVDREVVLVVRRSVMAGPQEARIGVGLGLVVRVLGFPAAPLAAVIEMIEMIEMIEATEMIGVTAITAAVRGSGIFAITRTAVGQSKPLLHVTWPEKPWLKWIVAPMPT